MRGILASLNVEGYSESNSIEINSLLQNISLNDPVKEEINVVKQDEAMLKIMINGTATKYAGDNSYGHFDMLLAKKYSPLPKLVKSKIKTNASDTIPSDDFIDYSSESGLIQAVLNASNKSSAFGEDDKNLSDIYQRCCKIWVRIATLPHAKNLMWEISEAGSPEYYADVKHPLVLANVATKLLNRSYDIFSFDNTTNVADEVSKNLHPVVIAFYEDMKQIVINCFSYYNESAAICGQANRVLIALYRHIDIWILSSNRPTDINTCDDSHCLLSYAYVIQQTSNDPSCVKCSWCCGLFSLLSLKLLQEKFNQRFMNQTFVAAAYNIFIPSQECLQGSYGVNGEEWLCPYCLYEDDVVDILVSKSSIKSHSQDERQCIFSLDEWGPSTLVPWCYNTSYNKCFQNYASVGNNYSTAVMPRMPLCDSLTTGNISVLSNMMNALQILTSTSKSPLLQQSEMVPNNDGGNDKIPISRWTVSERLTVYSTLCDIMKYDNPMCNKYIDRLYSNVDKLYKLSVTEPFCEGEYIEQIRIVSGEEGVSLYRKLLNGNEDEEDNEDSTLHNQLYEGRCKMCKQSTVSDDSDGSDVLLCDGCNGEFHLKCLLLDSVSDM